MFLISLPTHKKTERAGSPHRRSTPQKQKSCIAPGRHHARENKPRGGHRAETSVGCCGSDFPRPASGVLLLFPLDLQERLSLSTRPNKNKKTRATARGGSLSGARGRRAILDVLLDAHSRGKLWRARGLLPRQCCVRICPGFAPPLFLLVLSRGDEEEHFFC